MHASTKGIIAGAVIGAMAAGMLAIPSALPPTLAQEEPAATLLKTGSQIFREELDGSVFFRPPTRFNIEPRVATDVIEHRTVRKIGYGHTRFVDVYTTATGTYSSDGLRSPHVVYPGLHRNPDWNAWLATTSVAYLSDGSWVALQNHSANSFVDIVPFAGGRLGVREDGSTCVKVDDAMYC